MCSPAPRPRRCEAFSETVVDLREALDRQRQAANLREEMLKQVRQGLCIVCDVHNKGALKACGAGLVWLHARGAQEYAGGAGASVVSDCQSLQQYLQLNWYHELI